MHVSRDQQDLDLIERIKNGDDSAVKLLVDKHKDYAFTIAYRIVVNREEAEEVAQDAFIKMLRSLTSFKGESRFTTWFYRIVHNQAISQSRRSKVYFDDVQEHTELPGQVTIRGDLPDQERKQYLDLAISRLTPDDATMLTLFYLKEFSLDEIAGITQITANTAKVKLHRARKRLATQLHIVLRNEVNSLL